MKILFLFFLPGFIAHIFCEKILADNIKQMPLFLLAYGIAPLLSGFVFYCLIWISPGASNSFYLASVSAFWLMVFFSSFKYWKKTVLSSRNIFMRLASFVENRKLVFIAPIVFFLCLFSIQALFYPVNDNDSALYLNQSEAVYGYRNVDWQKEETVLIRGKDEYSYNLMIRPAIPSFMAFSFLIGKFGGDDFIFKFLPTYYYFLLLGLFLFFIYELSENLRQDKNKALFFGLIFFVFSWTLTRTYIFNSKETIIYFLALLSIYLTYLLIKIEKRDLCLEITLGFLLGLNAFVNLHGIIIGIFVLLLLFLLSPLDWRERIVQIFFIFVVQFFAGALEYLKMFDFIFQKSFLAIGKYLASFNHPVENIDNSGLNSLVPNDSTGSIASSNFDSGSLGLYRISNFTDLYVRGKFQILTNIGVFGFYFWFFVFLGVTKFKELISSTMGKIVVYFILVYFLIVLDPFNLNKNEFAIVLWGSTKYASLLLLLGSMFVAVYADQLISTSLVFIKKRLSLGLVFMGALCALVWIFKSLLVSLGLKTLLSVVPVFKEVSFYQKKIEIFYYMGIIFLFAILFSLVLLKINKMQTARKIFVACLLFFFVLAPFFVTDVGRVPLVKTFTYLNSDLQEKLENTLFEGDIFKVYFFAKKHLPAGTKIFSAYNEIYIYDDNFSLRSELESGVKYEIVPKCDSGFDPMYDSGGVYLCQG